jgi:hypothetical protein
MIKRDSKPNENPSTNRSEGQNPEMNNDLHELFLDELLAIVNGIEDFTHGQRRGGVLADQAEIPVHYPFVTSGTFNLAGNIP